jgi:hypothetical protein
MSEVATCPVCERIVEPERQACKLVLVYGIGTVSSDGLSVMVHEDHFVEFLKLLLAKIWPRPN